jgi:hypothetical protein
MLAAVEESGPSIPLVLVLTLADTVLALIIHATGSSSCIFCVNIKALFARDDDDA